MKRPAFMFYPADWRKDPELRVCSLAARGLWIDLLALMHEADPYGHLVINGRPVNDLELARMVGEDSAIVTDLLSELERNGVSSRNADGVLYSRRMVKDERKRNLCSEAGKLGGNPALKGNPNGTDNQSLKGQVNHEAKPNLTPSVAVAVSPSGELQKPSARRKRRGASDDRDTWLSPITAAHEAVYGVGTFAPLAGRFAKSWRRLVEIHGGEKCARAWAFSQRDERRRQFNTPEYVASHFNDFDPDAPAFPEDGAAA